MANVIGNLGFRPIDPKKQLRNRVELHLHLDGSVRPATIWDLAEKKGFDLGYRTFEEFEDACRIKVPGTLADFLKPIQNYSPVLNGDLEALERIALEACEDQAKQGVVYFETRYSPHLFTNAAGVNGNSNEITPSMVVESINRGLRKGEVMYEIKARAILCCILAFPDWSDQVVGLCDQYRNDGVVAIDIAGDEAQIKYMPVAEYQKHIDAFQKAAKMGIHRTVHAGEAGPAEYVWNAINNMKAERVGHGYHCLDQMSIYKEVLEKNIHLECCPHSSVLTGSIPLTAEDHPIIRFAEDNANFSISRDDATVTGTVLNDEYGFIGSLGLKEAHIARANFNAARSCFLPEQEKKELLADLEKAYGLSSA